MKQRGISVLVAVLALLTVVFCVLWQRALQDASQMQTILCE